MLNRTTLILELAKKCSNIDEIVENEDNTDDQGTTSFEISGIEQSSSCCVPNEGGSPSSKDGPNVICNVNSEQLCSDSSKDLQAEKPTCPNNERGNSSSSSSSSSSSASDFNEDSDDSVADSNYNSTESSSSQEDNAPNVSRNSDKKKVLRKVNNPCNTKKQGKKRVAQPENWIKNKAKCARNCGKSYTSSSTSKKVFQEKKLLPPCTDKCRLKCSTKIIHEDRMSIFKDYWNLGNLQRQRDFLLASIKEIKPKYRYIREDRTKVRSHNNAFYFEINGQKIQVCKTFFKATLSINDRPIRTILSKRTFSTNNMISTDLRGKHGKHARIDDNIKEGVRVHINSIPRIPSHYCRANTSREYIEGGKSLADIHRDYEQKCKEHNEPAANYMMYSRIFNEEFNISFFIPKKDQCELCIAYSNSTDEGKAELQDKYETHLRETKLARTAKDEDKNSQNSAVAVFDLQAVLPCPSGQASSFYYVSKLSVFNLTVFDLKSNNVKCFVWHEAEAHRGSNEIATCIKQYLDDLEEKANNSNDPKDIDVIFYSDNCAGQQKNKFLFAMYMYVLSKYKFIKSITHKFLITGHSQNEGDNAHSVIERQCSKAKRAGPIYTPDQYVQLIRSAKKNWQSLSSY